MIEQVEKKLYLISLPPPLPGFKDFIGIWLYTGPPAFLVDVGPSATSASLLNALDVIGIETLDYLLMTHIHIDHAGGIADIADAFPQAKIVAHSEGVPHLTQPERLWQGSLKALGRTALGYGTIRAVAAERVMSVEALAESRLQALPTPGHSPHHISYRVEDILFAGEAGGVCLSLGGLQPYMRPATPPRFFFDVTLTSLERLMASALPKIAYSHFGLFAGAQKLLQSHHDQLLLWKWIIGRVLSEGPGDDAVDRCLACLLQEDPRLHIYSSMPAAMKGREEMFLRNSIQGFIGDELNAV